LTDFVLERFTPGSFGPKSAYEHWSRYLFALRLRYDVMYLEGKVGMRYVTWAVRGAARRLRRLILAG
jgi:hypothetical protein